MISERLDKIEKKFEIIALHYSLAIRCSCQDSFSILFFDKLAAKEILMERANVKFTRE